MFLAENCFKSLKILFLSTNPRKYKYSDCCSFRDEVAADLLAAGSVDMAVGGASHGLSAALATRHVLHIQHQLGMHYKK